MGWIDDLRWYRSSNKHSPISSNSLSSSSYKSLPDVFDLDISIFPTKGTCNCVKYPIANYRLIIDCLTDIKPLGPYQHVCSKKYVRDLEWFELEISNDECVETKLHMGHSWTTQR